MDNKAQTLIGLHASLMLLSSLYGPQAMDLAGGLGFYVFFTAFLIAMPWWRAKDRHIATFWLWTVGGMAFGAGSNGHSYVVVHEVFSHALLLSALFLMPQVWLITRAIKVTYGTLLTCGLFALHQTEADAAILLCAYTFATVWCIWVVYDTTYWHMEEAIENPHELALQTVCDITVAIFASCLPGETAG